MKNWTLFNRRVNDAYDIFDFKVKHGRFQNCPPLKQTCKPFFKTCLTVCLNMSDFIIRPLSTDL